MASIPDVFRCPHCGHFISGQEPSSRGLFSYIEQLESFARIPPNWREGLRQGGSVVSDLRPLAILVAKMDHYTNIVNQHTANASDRYRAETYVGLLNLVLGATIPIIDQRGGSILELRPGSILTAWGFPMTLDDFIKAVSTALEMQKISSRLQVERTTSRDLALKIGVAGGQVYAGTIGPSTHQSFSVIGPAAVEANRLSDVAEPGQTLVDYAVYERTKGMIVYERLTMESEPAEQGSQPQYYVASCRK